MTSTYQHINFGGSSVSEALGAYIEITQSLKHSYSKEIAEFRICHIHGTKITYLVN